MLVEVDRAEELFLRLKKDIDQIPWHDRNISPKRSKLAVEYFIEAFRKDIQDAVSKEKRQEG